MKRISHFWVENCAVRYRKAGRPHVRFGSKPDMTPEFAMSAFPPKADIAGRRLDVRFVPIADIEAVGGYDRSGA
jgi:hypothetical protein